jgi:hypothetical protein
MSASAPFLCIVVICIFWRCSVIFVPVSQNTNFVVFVFVEVEAVLLTVFQLQEVIVQTLLAYAYFLGCFFERLACLVVEISPLLHFLDDFSNFTLFGSSGSFLGGGVFSLNQRFDLFASYSFSYSKSHDVVSWRQQIQDVDVLVWTEGIDAHGYLIRVKRLDSWLGIPRVVQDAAQKHVALIALMIIRDYLALHFLLSWRIQQTHDLREVDGPWCFVEGDFVNFIFLLGIIRTQAGIVLYELQMNLIFI